LNWDDERRNWSMRLIPFCGRNGDAFGWKPNRLPKDIHVRRQNEPHVGQQSPTTIRSYPNSVSTVDAAPPCWFQRRRGYLEPKPFRA
jgi:hypothetical protein